MLHLIGRSGIGVFVLLAVMAGAVSAQSLTYVSPQNQAVNAAIETAKSTLPVFFARLLKPQAGDSGFLVKIRYDKGKGDGAAEHIWAKDVVRSGDTISATIAQPPTDIPNLENGQRVTVPVSQITDWLYSRDGKYRGAYTVRALLAFMKPDEAEAMKKKLGPE